MSIWSLWRACIFYVCMLIPYVVYSNGVGVPVPWEISESEFRSLSEVLERALGKDHTKALAIAEKMGADYVTLAQWIHLHCDCAPFEEVENFRAAHPTWPDPLLRTKKQPKVTASIMDVKLECSTATKDSVFLNYSILPQRTLAVLADHLIWKNKVYKAEHLTKHLYDGKAKLITTTRAALRENKKGAEDLLLKALPLLKSHFGLFYDYMVWYNRNYGVSVEILGLLSAVPKSPNYSEELWSLYKIYIDSILNCRLSKFYKSAYTLAHNYYRNESISTIPFDAHWLLGWISFRYLHNYSKAYEHFTNAYNAAKIPEQRSKAAYWAAQTAKTLSNNSASLKWLKASALHGTTFYGQLSLLSLGVTQILLPDDPKYSTSNYTHCKNNLFAKLGYMLSKIGVDDIADQFVQHAVQNAPTTEDASIVIELILSGGNLYSALKGAKFVEPKLIIPSSLYPQYELTPSNNRELFLAVLRQESLHLQNRNAEDIAAKSMRFVPTSTSKKNYLTDHDLSLKYCLERMLKRYNHSLILALAAHNVGPNNVDIWIERLGDPRKLESPEEIALWIESIPCPETRDYLQEVLADLQVYNGLVSKPIVLQ